ncbi:PEGA domain-containing protein [Vibrio sp. 1567]|uniref:PEGA domain-containing protein n=1 Tax=Vibrio sp. 1567 TaxID=3074564 RepID=UPI00296401E7|nr:PEGA domain-containing protein [Vibrio sp. 1567]MDW2170142.1 PEGA domain-containing protein [Vibrio sp. 1567]
MEYVIVNYPYIRDVYIDGVQNGQTNDVLYIDAGTHTFDLGCPVDYTPVEQDVTVYGTSVLTPMEITFSSEA